MMGKPEPEHPDGDMGVLHLAPGGGFICFCCDNGLHSCNCIVSDDPDEIITPSECLKALDGMGVDLKSGPGGETCPYYEPRRGARLPWKKLAPKDRRPCEGDDLVTMTFDVAKGFAGELSRGENPFGDKKECGEMAKWFFDGTCDCGRTRIVLYYCDRHRREFEEEG